MAKVRKAEQKIIVLESQIADARSYNEHLKDELSLIKILMENIIETVVIDNDLLTESDRNITKWAVMARKSAEEIEDNGSLIIHVIEKGTGNE